MNNSLSNDSTTKGSANTLRHSAKWVILICVAATVMAVNVLMTVLLVHGERGMVTEIFAVIMFTCLGGFHAQAIVLGVWLVWGSEPIRHRAPACILLLYLVWLSWTLGAQTSAMRLPLEIMGMMAAVLGITFLMCALATGTLRIQRPHWRIQSLEPGAASDSQFTLASMMLWMLLVGLAMAASRLTFQAAQPSATMGGGPGVPAIVTACLLFGVYGAMVGIVATWLVLSPRLSGLALLGSFLACTLGPVVLGLLIVVFVGVPSVDWRFYGGLFCYTTGMYGATFVVLVVARGLGYRFQDRASTTTRSASVAIALDPLQPPLRREDLAE